MKRAYPLPPEVYALVEQRPGTVLLESALPAGKTGSSRQYSRLFIDPSRVFVVTHPAEIPDLFSEIERIAAAGGFAAGYFAYECASFFEPTAQLAAPAQPLAWFGIYPRCHLFDHQSGNWVSGDPPRVAGVPRGESSRSKAQATATPEITEREYTECIAAIHAWIRAGDVYQLNFTFPLSIRTSASPAALYAHLGRRQPVAYGAFLHTQPGRHILSFSPELFFRVDESGGERRITTRPMKGTARRGRTTHEDRAQAEWLRKDAKNRSENVMIVDLLRNDLGRLCRFGSVRVEDLFAVERYETLWQMTSTIRGTLRGEVGFREIFRALFPCGSVTGAPKVRAMQLLSQLEQKPRGLYTGAIGFFSQKETVFNVAIRTLEMEGGEGKMGVGSGIVIDSGPAAEFRECMLKAEFSTGSADAFPEDFQLVETLLWQDGYPLLALHLDRLADSSEYFGFLCDRVVIAARLRDAAKAFTENGPRKVRLLLSREGGVELAVETLAAATTSEEPVRVRIAPQRSDSSDRMFFHKTTHRPLYARAFAEATKAGFADVLFLNERGEVTEGAISNVLIETNGRWFTPPVECGLLPGVYRRHLLETRSDLDERVLYPEDLRQAGGIYLANAVRGLRRATIDWEA